MGQVTYLFFEEATLGWFQFQIIFLKVSRIQHAIDVSVPLPSVKTQLGHLGRSNSR